MRYLVLTSQIVRGSAVGYILSRKHDVSLSSAIKAAPPAIGGYHEFMSGRSDGRRTKLHDPEKGYPCTLKPETSRQRGGA